MNKKISIVIPVYCEEQVIQECYNRIKTVFLKLDSYDYEIIFVDDGSIDDTLNKLQSFAYNDNNIKYVVLGPLEREEYKDKINNDFYCLKNIIQYGGYIIFIRE